MLMAPLLLIIYDTFLNKDVNTSKAYDSVDQMEPTKMLLLRVMGGLAKLLAAF